MRAISLWQPWADLIVRGFKRYETRSWELSYRGIIAIHAAKKKFNSGDYGDELRRQMLQDEVDPFRLRYGCIVGFANVVNCQKTEDLRLWQTARELAYGNFEDNRFGWLLDGVYALTEPIPLPGHQGIFHWPDGDKVYRVPR